MMMATNDLARLIVWLGDVFLIIVLLAACCYPQRRENNNNDRRQGGAAAAVPPHAQPPPAPPAPAVQMAAMAVALLDHVTYRRRRQNVGDEEEEINKECVICLGQFEGGDWCSVMPVCRHEFHRSCIAKWLTAACNNTCPLCRAQLQWDVVALRMV